VATALNDGNNSGGIFCNLRGAHIPFDDATLGALYPSHGQCVSAVNRDTDQTVRDGFLLTPDAQETRSAAAASDYGKSWASWRTSRRRVVLATIQ
jgi:hypothetical protein